ncbi:MAG: hypothetical protein AAGA22_09490 [Pseudomonadota bacterium]
MLVYFRILFCGLALSGLAACAGSAPSDSALDAASRANISISDVVVDVSKVGAKTKGRAVPASSVKGFLELESAAKLVGHGRGKTPVKAVLNIESVSIITAGQSLIVGGESVMSGTVSLIDVKSGETVLAPQKLSAGGGGWTGGGLVAVATRDDAATEARQMSGEFVSRARILTLGNNTPSPSSPRRPIATPVAAPVAAAPKPSQTAPARRQLTEAQLQAEIALAQRKAEAEVLSKYGDIPCWQQMCERDVDQAKREAEARVRQNTATVTN